METEQKKTKNGIPIGRWFRYQRSLKERGLKCCGSCKKVKPLNEFHIRFYIPLETRTKKLSYKHACISCEKRRSMQTYERIREKILESRRFTEEWISIRDHRNQKLLASLNRSRHPVSPPSQVINYLRNKSSS